MDTESRRMVRAGDKRLLNWPLSSLPQHRTAGRMSQGLKSVGRAGDLTVIRGISACMGMNQSGTA